MNVPYVITFVGGPHDGGTATVMTIRPEFWRTTSPGDGSLFISKGASRRSLYRKYPGSLIYEFVSIV